MAAEDVHGWSRGCYYVGLSPGWSSGSRRNVCKTACQSTSVAIRSRAVRLVWLGRVVFLAAFALFCALAAPGLYLRDSGELATAGFSLGVAHETGFALWCLLAKAAALIPVGEVATRVTFFSALMGATTAWLVQRAVAALAPDDPAAAIAGVGAAALLCAGLTFLRAATVPEVYAPTAAAIALAILLAVRAAGGDRRAGLMLALLGGLSLGLHAQLRILVGPPVVVIALYRLRRGDRWPLAAPTAVALGAAILAYLPLRALRNPADNWSDPRTLGRVLDHVTAARIRHAFAGEMFHRVGAHLVQFAQMTEGQLGILALLFALVGLAWLLVDRARRPLGLLLLIILVADALYAATLNPMAIEDLQDGHPTALVLALAAGAGIVAAARRLGSARAASPWIAGALAVLIFVPAALADPDAKLGAGVEAASWSRAVLAQPPPRALLLVSSDDVAAGALYEQAVAGARPDVTVVVRQQLGDGDVRPRLRALVAAQPPGRAIAWEPGGDAPPFPVAPDVPLYELRPTLPSLPPARPLAEKIESLLSPARDPLARKLEAAQLTDLGRVYLERNDVPRAEALFESARAVRPNDAVAAIDLAVVRARQGDFAAALALVDGVVAREPDRLVARVNAGRYRLQLGDVDGAARELDAARALAPTAPAPLCGLARVALARGDRAAARRWLVAAEKLAPEDAEVRALGKELAR
jgi:tetratricopeptide (TPR) repeat protein